MKYSVGYQMRDDTGFLEHIVREKDKIQEVYFSWAPCISKLASYTQNIFCNPKSERGVVGVLRG